MPLEAREIVAKVVQNPSLIGGEVTPEESKSIFTPCPLECFRERHTNPENCLRRFLWLQSGKETVDQAILVLKAARPVAEEVVGVTDPAVLAHVMSAMIVLPQGKGVGDAGVCLGGPVY